MVYCLELHLKIFKSTVEYENKNITLRNFIGTLDI